MHICMVLIGISELIFILSLSDTSDVENIWRAPHVSFCQMIDPID